MTRSAWLLVVLALAPACKPAAGPAKPGSKLDVTVTHAAYADHSDTPADVKQKCKFDQKVAKEIVEFAPGASLSSGSSSKVLSMEVVTMRGIEPSYAGDRSVIVRGRLEDNGVEVGSFRIKRSASGGVFSGLSGVCRSLDEIAEIMGEDIAAWLGGDPAPNTDLGE
jgi:hypothetical protein